MKPCFAIAYGLLLAAVPLLGIAHAASNPPKPAEPPPTSAKGRGLSDERWSDKAYGLSLKPPLGVRMLSQTADDYLLRIADEGGLFNMSVSVKQSRSPLTLEKVAQLAQEQVGKAQGVAQLLSKKEMQLAGRPGIVMYFKMPYGKSGYSMFGQSVVQLSPLSYAVIEAVCDIAKQEEIQPLYEQMLASLEITDPRELDKQREAAIQAGLQFRIALSLKQIHSALVSEQYYRMVEAGKDIGYMRVRQQTGKRDGKNAVALELQYRFAMSGGWIDLLANYFLFDDDSSEQWSITTTRRYDAPVAPGKGAAAVTKENFVETGIRAGNELTITIDSPAGHKQQKFEVPKSGYLSQVEAWLLPQLLPIDRPATYGFYCYHSNLGKITYRTEQVTPTLDGYSMNTTLSPNEPAIRASFGSDRKLQEKALNAQRSLVPATPDEILKIWRTK